MNEPSCLVTAVLQGDPAKCAMVARDGELLLSQASRSRGAAR